MASSRLRDYFKYRRSRSRKVQRPQDSGDASGFLSLAQIPSQQDELVASLTLAQIKGILDDAAEGECSEQAKMIADMMEKDTIMSAHLETRKAAVLACDMKLIKPGTQIYEEQQDARYEALWDELEEAGIYELVAHLHDAFTFGYSGAVIDWGPGGGRINGFQPIHPTNINFDKEGNPALIVVEEDDPKAFADWHPNQFVLHRNYSKAGSPPTTAMGRTLAWLFYFKHFARKSWVRFLEKFGVPFLLAKLNNADFENTTLRKSLIAQLRTFASDGAVVTTEEGGVEAITVAGHHNRIHEEFIRRIDECYALAILGQVGSSLGEPGRLGNNQQQQDVREDRRECDCRRLMHTLNMGLVRPRWEFEYGTTEDCPVFVLNFTSPEDLEKKAKACEHFAKAGLRPTLAQISYEVGWEMEEYEPEPATTTEGSSDEE